MKSINNKIKKIFISQHDEADCGAACLLMIVKYFGGISSLETVRERCGTSSNGTTMLGLIKASEEFGLKAEGFQTDIYHLKKMINPIILHVHKNHFDHYIVCFGYHNDKFVIADPAEGVLTYNERQIENIWISKYCLSLEKDDSFIFKPATYVNMHKTFYKLIKEDTGLLIISSCIGIVISILNLSIAIFSEKLVDVIIPQHKIRTLILSLTLLFFVLVLRTIFFAVREYIITFQGLRLNKRLISFFYSHILELPIIFFRTRTIGDITTRFGDIYKICSFIKNLTSNFIIDLFIIIVSIVAIFTYSSNIGFLILTTIPLTFIFTYRYNKRLLNKQKNMMAAYSQCENSFINTINGIDVIKILKKQDYFNKKNIYIYNKYLNKRFDLEKDNIRLSMTTDFICVCLLILCITLISIQILKYNTDIGIFIAIITLTGSMLPSIINLMLYIIPLNEAKAAFYRMIEILSINKETNNDNYTIDTVYEVHFQKINFSYPGNDILLKNITVTFKKNEIVFITGENGTGKSTLCNILEKFYTPSNGEIIINHMINLKNISFSEWRKHIGFMEQTPWIINGTIMDNIILGDENISPNYILEKCEQWGINSFFNNLPQKYSTEIEDNGNNLSLGQKQIIAFIRVLIRNYEIIILDEPLASLDKQNSIFIMNLLTKIKEGRIIIIISHNIEQYKNLADKIYAINKGSLCLV